MPLDFYADLTVTPDVDRRWSSLALSFAEALARTEPRLRFRVRRIMPPSAHERESLLPPEALPEALRQHAALPNRRYFEVWNYRCKQCGIEGIPHGQRLLHDQHEGYERATLIKQSGFANIGIVRPWRLTHHAWFGPPERIAGRAAGHSYAITAGPGTDLGGFVAAALLPIRPGFNSIVTPPGTEVILLPKGVDAAAQSFLEHYLRADPEALDSVDEVAVERADQIRRAQEASRHLVAKGILKPAGKTD